MCYNMC